jgi:hypothetical protein
MRPLGRQNFGSRWSLRTLTKEDIETLGSLLNDHADRTAFYLHYYELTGNEQVAAMAKISHLTDFEGAVAAHANEAVESKFPDQYPAGGVFEFSKEIPSHLYNAIVADVNAGGSGILSERQVLEAAREAWDARGLGDQWPGNAPLAVERALDGDVKGALDAFDSGGTVSAINGAIYSIIPDISGAPPEGSSAPFIDNPDKYSYHLTENEKFGFFVDRETGMFAGVFDRLTEGEPAIESKGVLNAVPSEAIAPKEDPASQIVAPSVETWDTTATDSTAEKNMFEDRGSLTDLGLAFGAAALADYIVNDREGSSQSPAPQNMEAAGSVLHETGHSATDVAVGADSAPEVIDSFAQGTASVAENSQPTTWGHESAPTESPPLLDSASFGVGTAATEPDLSTGSGWAESTAVVATPFAEPSWPSQDLYGQSQDFSSAGTIATPADSGSAWGVDAISPSSSTFSGIGAGESVSHQNGHSDSGASSWGSDSPSHGGWGDSASSSISESTHTDGGSYGGDSSSSDSGSHGSSSSDSSGSTSDSSGGGSSGE